MKYIYKIWYCSAIVFLLINSFIDVTHAQPLPTSEQQQKIEQLKEIFGQITETRQKLRRVIHKIHVAQRNNNNNNNRHHEVAVVTHHDVAVVTPNDETILMRANADAKYTETQARAIMDRELQTTAPRVNLDRLLETFNADLQRLQNTLNNDVLRIQIRETFRQLPVATTGYGCDTLLDTILNRIANLVNDVEQMFARANREGRQLSQNQIAQAKRVLKIVQAQTKIEARRADKILRTTSTRKHTTGLLIQNWKRLQSTSAETERYIIFLNHAPKLLRHIRDFYAPSLSKDILDILEHMIRDIELTNDRLKEVLGSNNRGEIARLLHDIFPNIISYLAAINNEHKSDRYKYDKYRSGNAVDNSFGSSVLMGFFIAVASRSLANHNFDLLDITISLCPEKVLRTILYMQNLETGGEEIARLYPQEWEAIYYRIAAYLLRKNYRGALWYGFYGSPKWLTTITDPNYVRDLLHIVFANESLDDLTAEQQHENMATIANIMAKRKKKDRRYNTAATAAASSDSEIAEEITVEGESDVETAFVTTREIAEEQELDLEGDIVIDYDNTVGNLEQPLEENAAEPHDEEQQKRAPQRQETIQEELRRLLGEAEQIMRQLEAEEQARQEVINFIDLEQQARGELEINWLDNLRQLLRSGVFPNLGNFRSNF
jgi:hypothetical protein